MERQFNEIQSSIEKLKLLDYPDEILELFKDFIYNVPFILSLISPKRPYFKDLPRDEYGKAIIDITNPPILTDMDYFRPSAIHFLRTGRFTDLRPNPNPNSEYGKWIREEVKRCYHGMIRESDGAWVTGDLYFFLNYWPIMQTKLREGSKKGDRIIDFPEIWDGIFYRFNYIDQAINGGLFNQKGGNNGCEISSRGKAHPYSLEIYTPKGKLLWKDISIGDYIYGDDGNLTKVVDIPFDDYCDVYEIALKDGRKVKASGNHLWRVYRRYSHCFKTISTYEMMLDFVKKRKLSNRNKGVEYIYAIPANKGVEWNYKQVPIDPYTFGLCLGDGCFRMKKLLNNVYYTSLEEDMCTYLKYVPYDIVKLKTENGYFIRIPNVKYILMGWGLHMKKSEDKFIPNEYKYNSREVRLNILKGLMDSDGFVDSNGVPIIGVSSKQLADDIAFISRSLGYNCLLSVKKSGYKINGVYKKCLDNYITRIYTSDVLFNLERKQKLVSKFESTYSKSNRDFSTIVDIRKIGYEKCKCISVDNESQCYLIGDFITTHNSKSYCMSSMIGKRFVLGESETTNRAVKCMATAYLKQFLTSDGIMNKFQAGIDFLALNTQFPSKRLKSSLQDMTWKMGYKDLDTGTDKGTLNEAIGVSAKDDISKVRGKRLNLIVVEEFGAFRNVLELYNIMIPSVQEGDISFGSMYLIGTSGDSESDFAGAQEIVYNPRGYRMYGIPNVYDKEGQGRKEITFFFPGYLNRKGCYDKDGNSDVTKALLEILEDRYRVKYNSTDLNSITRTIAEIPITPLEALLRTKGNIFPITQLNERINQIDNTPDFYDEYWCGDLVLAKTGEVEFRPTNEIPIRNYPLKDNTEKGCIEIFEMPEKDKNGKVFNNRYIAGCLKEGELVNTSVGLKRVENITLDDKLINIDGEEVNIINLLRYYNENPTYNVKLYGIYNSTTFSEEHPIYCATPERHYRSINVCRRTGLPERYYTYDFNFRKAKDLKVGDVVKSPNIYIKEKPFLNYWKENTRIDKHIENPLSKKEFWWLLGLIVGDGWTSNNGYNINISFNAEEVLYIKKARLIVNNIFHRQFSQTKDKGTCVEFSFSCRTFNTFIKDNIGCGASNKNLAEWIKYIPKSLKKELILGYLASDGSVTDNLVEFVSTSLKLLNDVQDILFSLGIVSGVTKMKKYKVDRIGNNNIHNVLDKYHLRVSKIYTKIMKTWCATDLKLSKCTITNIYKSHNVNNIWISNDLNYIYFKVASIKVEPYIGAIYNFECNTHTFMCNYIPTHNCDPYDNDQANSQSLGSIIMLDLFTDRIVAEYTGRTTYAEELYEKCRLMCMFYKAKVNYESNLKGCFSYFSKMNCTHLLADTPEYLRDKQIIKYTNFGNNAKGVRATLAINNYADLLIKEWLIKPVVTTTIEDGEPVELTIPNLYFIRNRALLKELVAYNPFINVDRVRALGMLMLYREEKIITYNGDFKEVDYDNKDLPENDEFFILNYDEKFGLSDKSMIE